MRSDPFCPPSSNGNSHVSIDVADAIDDPARGGHAGDPIERPTAAADLIAAHPTLREPIIDGILRVGEVANIIAAPKMRKSYAVLGLGLSVVTGRDWMGKFPTHRGRVLLVDNELHAETLAYRIKETAIGLNIEPQEYADELHVFSLRGRLRDLYGLGSFLKSIEPGTYRLVILDALYRLLPPDTENDNAGMSQVYNLIDTYADQLRCGFAIVHHSSKGLQGQKSVVDVGAGAGAQSRAADAHLVLREHEEENCAVLDAVVRSWPPLLPLGLRWSYPAWRFDAFIDPSKIKRDRAAGGRKPKDRAGEAPAAEQSKAWTPEGFAREFAAVEPRPRGTIVALAIEAGVSTRDASRLFQLAELRQHIHKQRGTRLYSTLPPLLDRTEARSLASQIAALYPNALTDKLMETIVRRFQKFDRGTVETAITEYHREHQTFDWRILEMGCETVFSRKAGGEKEISQKPGNCARAHPPTPPRECASKDDATLGN